MLDYKCEGGNVLVFSAFLIIIIKTEYWKKAWREILQLGKNLENGLDYFTTTNMTFEFI